MAGTEEVDVVTQTETADYAAIIRIEKLNSTFGIYHPIWAHTIYTLVLLAATAGLVHAIWHHHLWGIVLFFLLRAIWRVRAKKELGIPHASVHMVGDRNEQDRDN